VAVTLPAPAAPGGLLLHQGFPREPTAERTGDFSALLNLPTPQVIYDPATTVCDAGVCTRQPFPGNIITSPLSNIAKAAEALLPATANSNLQNNYSATISNGRTQNDYFVKGDYSITDQHHLDVMYQTEKNSQTSYYNGGTELPLPYASGRFADQIITVAQLGETWTIKPNLLNIHAALAAVRTASKSNAGTSASMLSIALSSLTGESATFTTSGSESSLNPKTATIPRPSIAWVFSGAVPGVLNP
jgi:hypothetical protein